MPTRRLKLTSSVPSVGRSANPSVHEQRRATEDRRLAEDDRDHHDILGRCDRRRCPQALDREADDRVDEDGEAGGEQRHAGEHRTSAGFVLSQPPVTNRARGRPSRRAATRRRSGSRPPRRASSRGELTGDEWAQRSPQELRSSARNIPYRSCGGGAWRHREGTHSWCFPWSVRTRRTEQSLRSYGSGYWAGCRGRRVCRSCDEQGEASTAAALWKSKLDWPFEVGDGAFHDGAGRTGLVFGVKPTKVLAFGKGEPFSHDPLLLRRHST